MSPEGTRAGRVAANISVVLLNACISRLKSARASSVASIAGSYNSSGYHLCGIPGLREAARRNAFSMRVAALQTFAKSEASSAGVTVTGLFKNDSMVLNPRMSGVRSP